MDTNVVPIAIDAAVSSNSNSGDSNSSSTYAQVEKLQRKVKKRQRQTELLRRLNAKIGQEIQFNEQVTCQRTNETLLSQLQKKEHTDLSPSLQYDFAQWRHAILPQDEHIKTANLFLDGVHQVAECRVREHAMAVLRLVFFLFYFIFLLLRIRILFVNNFLKKFYKKRERAKRYQRKKQEEMEYLARDMKKATQVVFEMNKVNGDNVQSEMSEMLQGLQLDLSTAMPFSLMKAKNKVLLPAKHSLDLIKEFVQSNHALLNADSLMRH
ncbi:hypothetical protein RFI_27601 [Reticulomyxa filosa]|uniref:Uncharacterized protein n=1 Tax=Reticulomyxa filosa TaxID=46433 RepID=X6M810_RETFI|nr:hypothetical protein RFI_27601 [Reticulomyxa filosa]|eukprot:ETO09776.1 hypothetical protein RFI_27601 [Reticulomyxa filosa]